MDSSDPYEEEFADIGLSDFVIAHKRVARRKLECQADVTFSRDNLSHWEQTEPMLQQYSDL